MSMNFSRLSTLVSARSALVAAALSVIFLLIGARWIWVYRHGQPLDIDEAGYLSIALADYNAGLRAGFSGWLDAVLAPSIQGPLTTALASAVFWAVGPHIISAFAVPLVMGALCVLVTYLLALSIATRKVAILSSLLVASCPVIVNYSRSFHFSMPATFLMTVALLAIIKSNNFARKDWAILFGFCLGLMPLARTMTIAFMPGVMLAALFSVVVKRPNLLSRSTVLFSSLVLAAITSSAWLFFTWRFVFGYLFNFGYGTRAAEYGQKFSVFSIAAWIDLARYICAIEVYLLHFSIIIVGFFCSTLLILTKLKSSGLRGTFQSIISSNIIYLCIVIAESLLALASSQNKGSAFSAPVIPAMMIFLCWAILRVWSHKVYQLCVVGIIVLTASVAGIPAVDLRSGLAPTVSVSLPVLRGVTVTDGRGTIQQYLANGGFGSRQVAEPISIKEGQEWMNFSAATADEITKMAGLQPVIAFGFRNEIYNVNTVNLYQLIHVGLPLAGRQIEPATIENSTNGYKIWLRSDVADACLILTADLLTGEFQPPVNQAHMHEALGQSDMLLAAAMRAPDGKIVDLWKPKVTPPNCHH